MTKANQGMQVRFIAGDGTEYIARGEAGDSVMRCAVNSLVPGIIGECGGAMACATCHAYLAEPWLAKVAPPSPQEEGMLSGCIDVRPGSRLTCQIELDARLDGITFYIPRSQT